MIKGCLKFMNSMFCIFRRLRRGNQFYFMKCDSRTVSHILAATLWRATSQSSLPLREKGKAFVDQKVEPHQLQRQKLLEQYKIDVVYVEDMRHRQRSLGVFSN